MTSQNRTAAEEILEQLKVFYNKEGSMPRYIETYSGCAVGLDFETYSATDLPTHGLNRYVNDPTFRPLIASTSREGESTSRYNFVHDYDKARSLLKRALQNHYIVAQNAGFEQAVLRKMGLHYPEHQFIDSAVVARVAGAASRLEAAAPQLLGIHKMSEGSSLIKLFCVPGPYQEAENTREFVPQIFIDHPAELQRFAEYCDRDAELGLALYLHFGSYLSARELDSYAPITMRMNNTGWTVDLPLVEEMQRRYLENMEEALINFRDDCDAGDLNLNSLKQMKDWCAKRGIRASSFAEKPIARMRKRIEEKLATMAPDDPRNRDYSEVLELCKTKQILGGSSLKKLQVILDTAVPDPDNPGNYLLKDQYVHCGAGQTLRTTGRSAQMQNLKHLDETPADMSELTDDTIMWDNDQLAANIRQVFIASHPQGRLLVGDFKSVESRGLAWAANEEWKLEAYRQGVGIYEALASKIFLVPYDQVVKSQRTAGKVGELACGYNAGPPAVQSFAAGMNIELNEAEAAKIVYDWRDACPATVGLWADLDAGLHQVLEQGLRWHQSLLDGYTLSIESCPTPASLLSLHPGAQSIQMFVFDQFGKTVLRRIFHGCYVWGRNIRYYRPSDRKTGALWRKDFVDPKTKQVRAYEIYGGKLAGILTQSLCREIFFEVLASVQSWVDRTPQLKLVGQFHDEIVLDWSPGPLSLDAAKIYFHRLMSTCSIPSFPLDADIKDDYRYTK